MSSAPTPAPNNNSPTSPLVMGVVSLDVLIVGVVLTACVFVILLLTYSCYRTSMWSGFFGDSSPSEQEKVMGGEGEKKRALPQTKRGSNISFDNVYDTGESDTFTSPTVIPRKGDNLGGAVRPPPATLSALHTNKIHSASKAMKKSPENTTAAMLEMSESMGDPSNSDRL